MCAQLNLFFKDWDQICKSIGGRKRQRGTASLALLIRFASYDCFQHCFSTSFSAAFSTSFSAAFQYTFLSLFVKSSAVALKILTGGEFLMMRKENVFAAAFPVSRLKSKTKEEPHFATSWMERRNLFGTLNGSWLFEAMPCTSFARLHFQSRRQLIE